MPYAYTRQSKPSDLSLGHLLELQRTFPSNSELMQTLYVLYGDG